jgi:hypothetical protein
MAKRTLSVSDQANNFLILVEEVGSHLPGRRSHFVSQLSRDIFEALFCLLPEGKLTVDPEYLGVDADFSGFSRYAFTHGRVRGVYASSPDHVIVLELRIAGETFEELLAEAVA